MSKPFGRIALLIQATEETFHLNTGDILGHDRSQPLSSIRQLAMVVARERGFTSSQTARAFKRDRNTVYVATQKINYSFVQERPWWHNAKAALIDAWDEKLYPQIKDSNHAYDGERHTTY